MHEAETGVELRLLLLAARFATDHPYGAVGIFGAAAGSMVTYAIMTAQAEKKASEVVSGTSVEVEIPPEHLQEMLDDPTVELRWHFPLISVTVKSEQHQKPLELPVFEVGEN